MAQPSKVLLKGLYSDGQVKVRYVASTYVSTPYMDRAIERVWQEQQAKAKQQGYDLWDAEAYRLDDFSVRGSVLQLDVATVPYRVHSAMKELYADPQVNEANFDKLIVADALIEASDGAYILAQVDKVAEQEIVLVGGSCTKKRLSLNSAQDLFHFLTQRLIEVLNIPQAMVGQPILRGIIQNELGYVNLVFFVPLSLPSEAILTRFKPNNGVSKLVTVKESEAKVYLHRSNGYLQKLVELV